MKVTDSISQGGSKTHTEDYGDGRRAIYYKAAVDPAYVRDIAKTIHRDEEHIPERPPIFFCLRCNTAIITPPWFEDVMVKKLGLDPRFWLTAHVECCERTRIWYLISDVEVMSMDRLPKFIHTVLRLEDRFVKSKMVADQFL